MSIINRFVSLFGSKPSVPAIVFGRYSDVYKTPFQQAAWNKSVVLFEEGRALESYKELMVFLRDETADNLRWEVSEKGLQFECWQGSRRITGFADRDRIRMESRIAWAPDLNVVFMRRLAEQNFRLRYARFALTPDNCLAIVYDSHTQDGAPYKVLQALRELAINADKQDDILLDEFKNLRPVEEDLRISALPETERQIKIAYLRSQIEVIMEALAAGKPDPSRFPGGYVYLMLGTAFRIDYLVRPEGYVMDALEQLYQSYFARDERAQTAKIELMKKIWLKIAGRDDETLAKELYRTRSTFGINPGVGHDRVQALIDAELPKMDWYIDQGHPEIMSMAIARYTVGYGLYHYAPPPPDSAFFHLFYRITEQDYFRQLGYNDTFITAEGKLQKSHIEKAVQAIADEWSGRFPRLKPRYQQLVYDSLPTFSRSYLRMVQQTEL